MATVHMDARVGRITDLARSSVSGPVYMGFWVENKRV